jgi:hypothetical protein
LFWWCKPGATVEQQYHCLQNNIYDKLLETVNFWLYVWLGTCNLTQKDGKLVSIRAVQDSSSVEMDVNVLLVGVGVSGFWRCLRSLVNDIKGCND